MFVGALVGEDFLFFITQKNKKKEEGGRGDAGRKIGGRVCGVCVVCCVVLLCVEEERREGRGRKREGGEEGREGGWRGGEDPKLRFV